VTAGHTPGSLTLRLSTDQGDLWMIGDLSFTAAELGGKLAGIHADFGTVRRVQAVIAQLATTRPSLILPAHDPTVPARIAAFAK
jgi:glyoxylase-like metal-dependent hydrolase (beta-lactamase superfamily II)